MATTAAPPLGIPVVYLVDDEAVVRDGLRARLDAVPGLSVVAEGISDENDALQLRQMGCEYVQSFMFGAPVSGDAVLKILKEQYPVAQA